MSASRGRARVGGVIGGMARQTVVVAATFVAAAVSLATVVTAAGCWSNAGLRPPRPAHIEIAVRGRYAVEFVASFHTGLFHWVNSLAGASDGKTIPAYREQFERLFGKPTSEDMRLLRAFIAVRRLHAEKYGISAMLRAFMEAGTLHEAIVRLGDELPLEDATAVEQTLEHFRPRFADVWRDGLDVHLFLRRVKESGLRGRLSRTLAEVAGFYGVTPPADALPRVTMVPVPGNYGTHAQAVGRFLLLEVRASDGLPEQAQVIVHENAHYLWDLVDPATRARLADAAASMGPRGARAWDLLREALPTALGQGVADRRFQDPFRWSLGRPWYHVEDVDAYAKALYPLIEETLRVGGTLDAAFVRRAVELLPE